VDLLLGLGQGMTAWVAPLAAMRLVLFDYLLVVETLAWTQPGWLDRLHAFPPLPAAGNGETGLAVTVNGRHEVEARGPRIRLFPERSGDATPREERTMTSRESIMPTLTMSEHTDMEGPTSSGFLRVAELGPRICVSEFLRAPARG